MQDTVQIKTQGRDNYTTSKTKKDIAATPQEAYNVISKKYVASFGKNDINAFYFQLPTVNTHEIKTTPTRYNPVQKTIVKAENKPLNVFYSHELIAEYAKKQVSSPTGRSLVNNRNDHAFKYNVYEKKEKQTRQNETVLQKIPIVGKTAVNENYTFLLNNHIVQRSVSNRHNFYDTDWATIAFIIIGVLLAYSKLLFGKFFGQIAKSAFISSWAARVYSEKSLILNRLLILMSIISLLVFAAGFTLLFDFFGYSFATTTTINKLTGNPEPFTIPVWQSYFIFIVLISFIMTIKKLLNFAVGAMFDVREIVLEYRFHSNLYVRLSGLILLFPTVAIPYINDNNVFMLFYVLLFIVVFGYFLRILRLFLITIKKGFSLLYLFLYFCALEFGPCFMLYKLKNLA